MRPIRALLTLAAALLPIGAGAQPVVSAGPDTVAVTIYRAPARPPMQPINTNWLTGYALVTETRTVAIPAGRAIVRFEGVAGGILPESAIVTGLPQGVREKNLDADLLSPWSLYARSLGRPVTLRRSVGGKTIEEPAIIRSGPEGAAILETKAGFIAADCSGRQDQLIYGQLPDGLTARPTLSIELDSPRAGTAHLTLSYIAFGFDWQASYVATMRPGGRSADLFAWVTLASNDVTSFPNAETMVVAGKVQSESGPRWQAPQPGLVFRCFPRLVAENRNGTFGDSGEIVVTGMRMEAPAPVAEALQRVPGVSMNKFAQQEALGDLNLYRVPERTTLASRSQKQVGLLEKKSVPVDVVYRTIIFGGQAPGGVRILLRAQNRRERGLGLPLPSGTVAVFEPLGERRLLLGEGAIGDKAVNEEVEVDVAGATQVTTSWGWRPETATAVLSVANANPAPVRFEAEFYDVESQSVRAEGARMARKNGRPIWRVEVPANGRAELRYRMDPLQPDGK